MHNRKHSTNCPHRNPYLPYHNQSDSVPRRLALSCYNCSSIPIQRQQKRPSMILKWWVNYKEQHCCCFNWFTTFSLVFNWRHFTKNRKGGKCEGNFFLCFTCLPDIADWLWNCPLNFVRHSWELHLLFAWFKSTTMSSIFLCCVGSIVCAQLISYFRIAVVLFDRRDILLVSFLSLSLRFLFVRIVFAVLSLSITIEIFWLVKSFCLE